ncbi:uncharacterized protein M6B38_132045 [Iris pallida]|uniref:Uncharacterized protein n=1 Tax=Iris pallida TaxID=29817 RepID=A0AAX6FS48_IRIPA|nr:uncharacterized protein M6B38_132045 [Iris pallida]
MLILKPRSTLSLSLSLSLQRNPYQPSIHRQRRAQRPRSTGSESSSSSPMESLSLRAPHRRNQSQPLSKYSDVENDAGRGSSSAQDPLRLICGRGFVRLVLVSAILWMLLILAALALHLWSCHSSISFLPLFVRKIAKCSTY